jgi:hypothetical protein
MDKEKDEISTRLRLPKELHYKLGVLADLDDRSLHNYMIKALQDHVFNAEKNLLDVYGDDNFDAMYISIFGDKYDPYLFEMDIYTEILNPQIDIRDEHPSRINGRKIIFKKEKRKQMAKSESVAEESQKYSIKDDDKSDNS